MAFTLDQQIIFAVRARNLELVMERIEAGGDLNYQDSMYGSALVSAINNGDEVILQFLIDSGADVNAENVHGIVPLETALHQANRNIVRKLSWSGAKLKSRSRPHWKELLEACLNDN
ncbi:MAG: ankyrin repeat domain-containing protein [Neptuniibacter sp.]